MSMSSDRIMILPLHSVVLPMIVGPRLTATAMTSRPTRAIVTAIGRLLRRTPDAIGSSATEGPGRSSKKPSATAGTESAGGAKHELLNSVGISRSIVRFSAIELVQTYGT